MEKISNIIKVNLILYTEWFWQYKISLFLLFVVLDIGLIYIIFGTSLLLTALILLFKLLLGLHIILSVNAILKDYIYNKTIVYFCVCLLYLISMRLYVEILL